MSCPKSLMTVILPDGTTFDTLVHARHLQDFLARQPDEKDGPAIVVKATIIIDKTVHDPAELDGDLTNWKTEERF